MRCDNTPTPRRSICWLLLGMGSLFLRRWCAIAFVSRSQATSFLTATATTTTLARPVATLLAMSTTASSSSPSVTANAGSDTCVSNPLLNSQKWKEYNEFAMPPFDLIETSHFQPAFEQAMEQHTQELQEIVNNADAPTFENVIVKLDRCGAQLDRVQSVYSNMCSSLNTEEMQKVQTTMTPILSRHYSSMYIMPGLFDKIKSVHDQLESLDLTPEQSRLVERFYLDFVRAGANFDTQELKQEYANIKEQLATLTTKFDQNLLRDESTVTIQVTKDEMRGCPDFILDATKQAAKDRDITDENIHVLTLDRSTVEPFLTFCDNRSLRKSLFEKWTSRGQLDPENNNLLIAVQILKLRKQMAALHGYKTFAEYTCKDRMAKTPENVMQLLMDVWERAKQSCAKEEKELINYIQNHKDDIPDPIDVIEPWDWRYVAEKVRKAKYDFDESLLKPYLSLNAITKAMFGVSSKLFGLSYVERTDLPKYHPDVNLYEVFDSRNDNKLQAIFVHDNYARPFKSSGAWMSEYRSQTKNLAPADDPVEAIPIVSNNNNFAKGEDTLLSYDDAQTLFHEFGHAHHSMLSDATYGRLASTNVLLDFVELPSQLFEHWIRHPSVLQEYAKHYQTNEDIPMELLERLKAAEEFNQGFATIEFTACAILDMIMHNEEDIDFDNFDMNQFEKEQLAKLGMPHGIVMRHRPSQFSHLFASNYYAAGYYVYLWAEVLDADAFGAFKQSGDVFSPEVAQKARQFIYSAGNTVAPDELFRQFRGRDPDTTFMLKQKGLLSKE